jgi:hypothetical protein
MTNEPELRDRLRESQKGGRRCYRPRAIPLRNHLISECENYEYRFPISPAAHVAVRVPKPRSPGSACELGESAAEGVSVICHCGRQP